MIDDVSAFHRQIEELKKRHPEWFREERNTNAVPPAQKAPIAPQKQNIQDNTKQEWWDFD